MSLIDLFKSILHTAVKASERGAGSNDADQREPLPAVQEYFGNVLPDRRAIQTSTGKLYPPNMARTQPGEYGLRTRVGKNYQEALSGLINDDRPIWSGRVTVSIVGKVNSPSLEIKKDTLTLGAVSSATLAQHPQILQAVNEKKSFRGSAREEQGGIMLCIFVKI